MVKTKTGQPNEASKNSLSQESQSKSGAISSRSKAIFKIQKGVDRRNEGARQKVEEESLENSFFPVAQQVLPEQQQDDDSFNMEYMYDNEEKFQIDSFDIDDEKQRKQNESLRLVEGQIEESKDQKFSNSAGCNQNQQEKYTKFQILMTKPAVICPEDQIKFQDEQDPDKFLNYKQEEIRHQSSDVEDLHSDKARSMIQKTNSRTKCRFNKSSSKAALLEQMNGQLEDADDQIQRGNLEEKKIRDEHFEEDKQHRIPKRRKQQNQDLEEIPNDEQEIMSENLLSNENAASNANKKRAEFEFYAQCIQAGTPINKGPRRPLSPYIFFSQEKRKELKRQNPDWSSGQIMKQVSILWQKMSNEEKQRFQVLSKEDRNRYENQREEFTQKKAEEIQADDANHKVIDTVRSRAKIVAEEMQRRKVSEEQHAQQQLQQQLQSQKPIVVKKKGRKNKKNLSKFEKKAKKQQKFVIKDKNIRSQQEFDRNEINDDESDSEEEKKNDEDTFKEFKQESSSRGRRKKEGSELKQRKQSIKQSQIMETQKRIQQQPIKIENIEPLMQGNQKENDIYIKINNISSNNNIGGDSMKFKAQENKVAVNTNQQQQIQNMTNTNQNLELQNLLKAQSQPPINIVVKTSQQNQNQQNFGFSMQSQLQNVQQNYLHFNQMQRLQSQSNYPELPPFTPQQYQQYPQIQQFPYMAPQNQHQIFSQQQQPQALPPYPPHQGYQAALQLPMPQTYSYNQLQQQQQAHLGNQSSTLISIPTSTFTNPNISFMNPPDKQSQLLQQNLPPSSQQPFGMQSQHSQYFQNNLMSNNNLPRIQSFSNNDIIENNPIQNEDNQDEDQLDYNRYKSQNSGIDIQQQMGLWSGMFAPNYLQKHQD